MGRTKKTAVKNLNQNNNVNVKSGISKQKITKFFESNADLFRVKNVTQINEENTVNDVRVDLPNQSVLPPKKMWLTKQAPVASQEVLTAKTVSPNKDAPIVVSVTGPAKEKTQIVPENPVRIAPENQDQIVPKSVQIVPAKPVQIGCVDCLKWVRNINKLTAKK